MLPAPWPKPSRPNGCGFASCPVPVLTKAGVTVSGSRSGSTRRCLNSLRSRRRRRRPSTCAPISRNRLPRDNRLEDMGRAPSGTALLAPPTRRSRSPHAVSAHARDDPLAGRGHIFRSSFKSRSLLRTCFHRHTPARRRVGHYTEIARWRCLRTCWFEPTRLAAHAFGFRCLASTSVCACPIDANSFRLRASLRCGSAHLTLLSGDFVPGFQDSAACWFAVGVGSNQHPG